MLRISNLIAFLVYAVDFYKEVAVNLCYCVVFNHRYCLFKCFLLLCASAKIANFALSP